jgi:hypothetical protein
MRGLQRLYVALLLCLPSLRLSSGPSPFLITVRPRNTEFTFAKLHRLFDIPIPLWVTFNPQLSRCRQNGEA